MHVGRGAHCKCDCVREQGQRVSSKIRKNSRSACAYSVLSQQSELISAPVDQISAQIHSSNLVERGSGSLRGEIDLVVVHHHIRAGHWDDDELGVPVVHVALCSVLPAAAPVETNAAQQDIPSARHHRLVKREENGWTLSGGSPVRRHRLLWQELRWHAVRRQRPASSETEHGVVSAHRGLRIQSNTTLGCHHPSALQDHLGHGPLHRAEALVVVDPSWSDDVHFQRSNLEFTHAG
mmetsp:Transcript_79065/g.180903  ORF Transcript_79065/g.180903 Transcript_79065/m.180903 type:complete len:236 (-) Transcript_79065:1000-1707(-)